MSAKDSGHARPKQRRKRLTSGVGYCYLIAGPDGLFKIGKSADPLARLLQIAPRKSGLELLYHFATSEMNWLETYLHRAFSHKRVRREWFRLTPEDVSLLGSIVAADNIDELPSQIVASYKLNEVKGFACPMADKGASVPQRRTPAFQFYCDDELAAAFNEFRNLRRADGRLSRQSILETAVKEYLEKRGFWPRVAT